MSGSLSLNGGTGKWIGTTANNSLAVNQHAICGSVFVKLAVDPSTFSRVNVFTTTLGASGAFFIALGSGLGGINGIIQLKGSNATLNYHVPASLLPVNAAIHIGFELLDVGTTRIWINGVTVATGTNLGMTSSSACGIQIGCDALSAFGFLLSDPAFWIGGPLTQADWYGLRNRSLTPLTTSIPAAAWWLCSGTAGQNPAAGPGDPGMADQIGSNHITTMPGTGNLATSAVYSSTVLNYIPPITLTAVHVNRSGHVMQFGFGTNPLNGAVDMAFPQAVNGDASVMVNGSARTVANGGLVGPTWSSVKNWTPFVGYQVVPPIMAGDTVTYTTPDSWVKASQGISGAESGTASNYVGQWEPGLWNYPGFNLPPNQRTLLVGFDGLGTPSHACCSMKNAAHRCTNQSGLNGWLYATTLSADGYPLTISNPWYTQAVFWKTDDNNGIDSKGFPAPTGRWTFVFDEYNPSSPGVFTPICNSSGTWSNLTSTPGTVSGGVEYGKTWTSDLAYNASPPTNFNLSLQVKFTTTDTVGGVISLRNLRIFDPNNAVVSDPGILPNDNYLYMLQSSSPSKFAAAIRIMLGSDGASAAVNAGDYFQTPTSFSYGDPPSLPATGPGNWPQNNPGYILNRSIPIHQVRKYDLAVSPKVYSHSQYHPLRYAPSTGYDLYEFVPANWGMAYDWPYPNQANSTVAIVEFVCADVSGNPIPHNLRHGQYITLPAMTFSVTNANGNGVSSTAGAMAFVWPTSDHTWVSVIGTKNLTAATGMAWFTSSSPVTLDVTATYIGGLAGESPIESFGVLTQNVPGMALWLDWNHSISDAGARAMAQRAHDSTTRGTIIYFVFSNEMMIPNVQFTWINQIFPSMGVANIGAAYIRRSWQIFQILQQVWGSDAGSLRHVAQVFGPDSGTTTRIFSEAQADSIPIDHISIAPYMDMDQSPEFAMAAAQMCSSDPRSIANAASGVVSVTKPVLPAAGFCDYSRYRIRYAWDYNGPRGYQAVHTAAMVGAGYGQGGGSSGFTYPQPTFAYYECAYTQAVPPGVSHSDSTLRGALSHDLSYHPAFYEVIQSFLEECEQTGPAGTIKTWLSCMEALGGFRQFSPQKGYLCTDGHYDGGAVSLWGIYIWQGQRRGPGLSNRFFLSDFGGDGQAHDQTNESPIALAYADWIAGVSPPPPPTSFTVSPLSIPASQPAILTLAGISTTWSGSSTVSVQNSVTGTTTVTAGSWNATTPTSATLAVSAGAGVGTFTVTVDGVVSSSIATTGGAPPPKGRGRWEL
jgi:hypothetical protein